MLFLQKETNAVMRTRILFFLLCLLSVLGCSSEKLKIKKALKSSIPSEQVGDYKFKSYSITETLLEKNVQDSISALQSKNAGKQVMIDNQIRLREGYLSNLEDCKRQQRTTLSWLRSSYNSLIRQWQEMVDESNEKIQVDSAVIVANNQKIDFFKDYLNKTKSPIVFYKVHHSYTLGGAIKNDDVMLDENYNLVQ